MKKYYIIERKSQYKIATGYSCCAVECSLHKEWVGPQEISAPGAFGLDSDVGFHTSDRYFERKDKNHREICPGSHSQRRLSTGVVQLLRM